MTINTALIVDDDLEHSAALGALLEVQGFEVTALTRVADVHGVSDDASFDVAFITLHCHGEEGIDLLDSRCLADAREVILMNAYDEPDTVSAGIGRGATYFFCKPFDEDFIKALLSDLKAEVASVTGVHEIESPIDQFALLRGGSAPMRKLYRIMRKVAPTETSVLLIGESGTGKELVAQSLHMLSQRSTGPFVAMNCAAVPRELFESELFGHERGSFSGAVRQHLGLFERAHGGTLFLDEITEMPVELQAKLLRVLELGEFRRVGGEEKLISDARIVSATNSEPELAIGAGRLREDLYYRLARFPLRVPALRDRADDIVGLARFFLGELNLENGTSIGISAEALEAISAAAWPGNVRQLRSVLERAYILANDKIEVSHLGALEEGAAADGYIRVPATASVEEAEKQLILAALEEFAGNKQAAAESLGISLKTLYNRLNEYAAADDDD